MKNPAPHIRRALFTVLNGNVSYDSSNVPVYENEGLTVPLQILIREYSDSDRSTKNNFGANASQTIEIVSEQNDSTRKTVDEVGELVMDLIKPDTRTNENLSDSDVQVMITGKPSISHLTENSGSSTKIVRLILRYNFLIVDKT